MAEMYEMNETTKETQNNDVLNCMKIHGFITDDMAREWLGVRRLSARIFDLREQGNEIKTLMCEGKNRHGHHTRFAKYLLEKAV